MPWATHAIRPLTHRSTTRGAPRESWWICREDEFSTKASAELARMRLSKFGAIQLGTTESDAKIARRRLLPV